MDEMKKRGLIEERKDLVIQRNALARRIDSIETIMKDIGENECKYSELNLECEGCEGGTNNGKDCNRYKINETFHLITTRLLRKIPKWADDTSPDRAFLYSLLKILGGE